MRVEEAHDESFEALPWGLVLRPAVDALVTLVEYAPGSVELFEWQASIQIFYRLGSDRSVGF